jgi:eukaryotic-like serine/threonine-protein kinase
VGPAAERRLSAGSDQIVTATGEGDFRFVRTIRYAGQPFGKIEVVVDNGELDAAAASSRDLLIGLGIALLLVVMAISYAIGQSVARPVNRLRAALNDAASGKGDFRISHSRKDDFGRLFDAFNNLAEFVEGRPAEPAATVSLDATRIGSPIALEPQPQHPRRRSA